MHILEKMDAVLSAPLELTSLAPSFTKFSVHKDKVKVVIGMDQQQRLTRGVW